jgi:shikimate dehydrogenase
MRKFGLIGYPLGHSFSKKYFTEKFRNENISDCSYDLYPIEDINLLSGLIGKEPLLCGFNVTIPYKTSVISLLDFISPEAKEIGAVNVVKIERKDGRISLSGYNSDVTGFGNSLRPFLRNDIKSAIVLGTGGSSKAVCHVLKKLGIAVTLVSRDRKPGSIDYSELNPDLLADNFLIVNTTPLGMFPNVETFPPIDYDMLGGKHVLFDLVYNPELTSFLKMGKERGCTTVSGIKMLHLQAEKAWEIWNQKEG